MEQKMNQGKVVKKIIRNYNIKHGDLVDINILKLIAAKEKIDLEDLMMVFKISVGNRNRLKRSPLNKASISLFEFKELKEMKVEIEDKVAGRKITQKLLNRLSNQYKLNLSILNKMLNIRVNETD